MPRVLIDEKGNATVATAGIISALCALLLALGGAAKLLVDERQAQLAADMAAVAGAYAHVTGENACAVAEDFARHNHAQLSACEIVEEVGDVLVTATVGMREAQARAGPL
ncbi:TadE-like protein [Corynebacterium yudongzhengii]|uniref:TadE-like protein n=1 Tax=Corynebacterium yudongzhengii TaxID=2080740 RepID=A0A2U1T5C8_9CORY|nr:Rv3654c family TadE-like protein [Corynebacterium yudongzhengii]AWB81099.1 TadE-like protein [Corynebacterium yudongzhengii]PWC01209.1 TadE-like protein [Corynebacterium yudongzhengii]